MGRGAIEAGHWVGFGMVRAGGSKAKKRWKEVKEIRKEMRLGEFLTKSRLQ
ncbi:hypothetical protein [Thermococcus sp. M36]|uniref:hypothetical protein n=1 Tax=Thermococcus sp. M36 TaxID=1638261 RepID=UPI00143B2756|nr:hypothetical protein [Thermococcus sp. M36]